MKRKVIALVLTIALLAVSMFGCGSNDNYFSELERTIKHVGSTTESIIKIKIPKEAFVDGTTSMPVDVSNGLNATLRVVTMSDTDGNGACDIEVMMNGQDEYAKFTSIVKYGKYLYVQTDSILSFISQMGLDPKGETAAQFKQFGIEKAAKVDIKQACRILEIDYDEDTFNLEKHKADLANYVGDMVDILDDYFENLTSKDGRDYILKVDRSNATTAIDDAINFIDNGLKDAYDETYDLVKEMGGEKSAKDFPKYAEVKENAKESKAELKEGKKDASKNIGDCVFTSRVNSKEKKITFGIENYPIEEDWTVSIMVDTRNREDDHVIKDLIPSDAVDVTALLKEMKQMAEQNNANISQY
ncbi:MAG: hypothetical protein IKF24_01550 [Eubacterium sp.]|nr:hypothetical protein [Eubacterium sp.]